MIQINKVNKSVYIAEFEYNLEDKDTVKDCGFKFNRDTKQWWSENLVDVNELAELIGDDYVEKTTSKDIEHKKSEDHHAYFMSSAKKPQANLELVAPDGLEYKAYQFAFLEWWKQRTTNGYKSLLEASEMGIGKTIETVMIMNIIKNPDPKFLIICPAGLKINWEREIRKWTSNQNSVQRIDGAKTIEFNQTNTSIINYDILPKHRESIDKIKWDLIIIDEAHYLKSPKAKRTQAVLGGGDFKPLEGRKLFLTGTPLINRPAELWTLVKACDPNGLGSNWHSFHERYCEGHKNRWGGWDLSGASNLEEFIHDASKNR